MIPKQNVPAGSKASTGALKMKYVFISYVREDSEIVIRLKNLLQRAGEINVWLDRDSIEPGQRWKDTIRKAISGGAYFSTCRKNGRLYARWR